MKKILKSSFILLAFISNSSFAQKIKAENVPGAVKKSFEKAFPGTTAVKWELEDKNYEANFKSKNHSMSAVIDATGILLETETEIPVSELPPIVKAYISRHYRSATIKEAATITKANGELIYEAEVNHKDILFNSKGEFIKEENN